MSLLTSYMSMYHFNFYNQHKLVFTNLNCLNNLKYMILAYSIAECNYCKR